MQTATHPENPNCPLWKRIATQGLRTVAVMGMTKNTGKTVSLNHLIAQAGAARMAVGLTSIGRDGEAHDEVFSIPKPPVRVMPGSLIATASDTLVRAGVRTKLIGTTGIGSPMGEILIVKALAAGSMEVAGASRSHDQRHIIGMLRQCGAELVLIDGALGRSHHASPAMADGVVLATGAAIGGGMDDVLRKTRDRLSILGISPAPAEWRPQLESVFGTREGRVGVWRGDGTCLLQEAMATVNAADRLLALSASASDIGLVAMSGAVGKLLCQALRTMLARHPGLTVVVADGTRLFIDARDLACFEREGGKLYAMRGIALIGVALNPCSPFDGGFDADTFLIRARAQLPGHTVTDVMLHAPESSPDKHKEHT